jgi:hypothetical protein
MLFMSPGLIVSLLLWEAISIGYLEVVPTTTVSLISTKQVPKGNLSNKKFFLFMFDWKVNGRSL